MTLGIMEYENKKVGFGTYLSSPRPAGIIIDEIILLHRASELDNSKTKVTLPRLNKINRICFEVEDTPIEITWGTDGCDTYDEDTSWGHYSEGAIACLVSPKNTESTSDGAIVIDRTVTQVLGRILAMVSGLGVIADIEEYYKAHEAHGL